ncbi:hypothetical protein T4E_325 [Trichinella pseudospiralis]|uniref:Uncharacterized protein n=1 Tax=Trichinella pseudospiralis TaxID=6337 RepID=A0A0V0YHN7_TRIPS|nr:hypothetical protein T4E_325 [Trichinella pseudospiralis]
MREKCTNELLVLLPAAGKLTAWQMAHQLLSYLQLTSPAVAPLGRPVANGTPIALNNRLLTMDQEKTSARRCNPGCKLSTNPTARWDLFHKFRNTACN